MKKSLHKIFSSKLDKEMELAIYGHYGMAILLIPGVTDNYLEFEQEGLIDCFSHNLIFGSCQIYSVEGILDEIWRNNNKSNYDKSKRQFEFNAFLEDELVPAIHQHNNGPVPIMTFGVSNGAYFAANAYFRRPDIFTGTIAISGKYDLLQYTNGYFDENIYFNSPVHYLPNLNDNYYLTYLQNRPQVFLASGSGENEAPFFTTQLNDILKAKGIDCTTIIKNETYGHNFDSWKKILPEICSKIF